jgi:hypothetical protein
VLIKGENEITGKLAGIVESGAKIVIRRMSAEFAENLAARCSVPPPAEGQAGA